MVVRQTEAAPRAGVTILDVISSSLPAFVWDGATGAVSWMNSAARERYGGTEAELSARLTKKAARLLCGLALGSGKAPFPAEVCLRLKKKRHLLCEPWPMTLTGGHAGVVVIEIDGEAKAAPHAAQPHAHAPLPPQAKPSRKPARKGKKAARPLAPPKLSPEDLTAFEALGRKVRKLCRQKQKTPAKSRAANGSARRPAEKSRHTRELSAKMLGEPALFAAVLPAFDAVLKLDAEFHVACALGETSKAGLGKKRIKGANFLDLFPPEGGAELKKAAARLGEGARSARADVRFCDASGQPWCGRIVLGVWPSPDARYFAALTMMKAGPAAAAKAKAAQPKKLAA